MGGFHHSDDQESASAKQDVLAKTAIAINVNLEFPDRSLVQKSNLARSVDINLTERATTGHLAPNGLVPRRPDAIHCHAINQLCVALNAHGQINDGRDPLDRRALLHDRLCFTDFQSALLPRELGARDIVRPVREDIQPSSTNALKFRQYLCLQPRERSDHRGNTRNADNDAKRREE